MKATKEEFIACLRRNRGKMTFVAKELGCTLQAVSQRIKENVDLQWEMDSIGENILDMAEIKLEEKVSEKDLGALCFLLKCKGKKRGYVERTEHTGADGQNLFPKIEVTSEKDKIDTQEFIEGLKKDV
jgi:hypothetical protein